MIEQAEFLRLWSLEHVERALEQLPADVDRPRRAGGIAIQAIADSVPILPFHEPAAHTYAELRAELERRGTPLAEPDLRIAAIALSFNLVLVTGNERHFRRVPNLVVENWLEPQP